MRTVLSGYKSKPNSQESSEKSSDSNFSIREIQPGDVVTKLKLGDKSYQPLKSFLKTCAAKYHKNNVAKTYVAVNEQRLPRIVPDNESS